MSATADPGSSAPPGPVLALDEFDYEVPEALVAQEPSVRGRARMLVVPPRADGSFVHASVADLPDLLLPGDRLVVNDTRVLKARLRGQVPTGGAFELLLLEPVAGGGEPGRSCWRAAGRPGRRLVPGAELMLSGGLPVRVDEMLPDGNRLVSFPLSHADFLARLEELGEVPLPPYIRRMARPDDAERYQTVFSRAPGAVAAPTAGLHIDASLLERLAARGVATTRVTLHVGAGTFRPVAAPNALEHDMHEEAYGLGEAAARELEETRAAGGRIVAVGTTSLRVLETVFRRHGRFAADAGRTRIFLHRFDPPRSIDGLLTNFHTPRSTLLMLVDAWQRRAATADGPSWRRIYEEAVGAGYRLFSYGDCMLSLAPRRAHS